MFDGVLLALLSLLLSGCTLHGTPCALVFDGVLLGTLLGTLFVRVFGYALLVLLWLLAFVGALLGTPCALGFVNMHSNYPA